MERTNIISVFMKAELIEKQVSQNVTTNVK